LTSTATNKRKSGPTGAAFSFIGGGCGNWTRGRYGRGRATVAAQPRIRALLE